MSPTKDHHFKHTTASRRASVVYGSLGKGGLYAPSDFLHPSNEDATIEQQDPESLITSSSYLIPNENTPLVSQQQQQPFSSTHIVRNNSTELLQEERDLLRDNNLIPSTSNIPSDEEEFINDTWEEAVLKGKIKTSVPFEMKTLARSSAPLIVTFILQNSLSLASIFSVGHIGKQPLAGITLGSMTANITGFAAIQGLTTCLDTLCSQAFGAGKSELVGLHFIRCSLFAITCFIPMGAIWIFYSGNLLRVFVPESEMINIAANYLKIVSFGMPGFILFECGKRFLQSQGVFHASTYVLLVCAPFNALMNYLLVWKFGFGYKGAPMAVMMNYWLMPLGLLIFVLWNREYLQCWPKNFRITQAFENWGKMIELALPGVIMVEAEFVGFEIITIIASNLGTTELAAQSVVSSICSLAYQVPFSVSIATATRVANYVGASLPKNARICCQGSMNLGFIIGCINSFIMFHFRREITHFFTNDVDVIEEVLHTMPVIGFMGIIDCVNACSAGCMRGQGLQKIGGMITLFAFYVIGIPCSYYLCFHFEMGLKGLWAGIIIGLVCISCLQLYTVFIGSNWEKIVDAAKNRNAD
ncbi:CYFA0S19e01090g1_1 [Cyberlindnera fabianii]|uniref:CYFA0S19e01090g1_1 n=1 Tax=Cyberlindnera fabianii TaxID=36022 RepID=A0A061BCN2_CYBFA|nr:CYFA0S19e01090g1_1 [Cyberlindnera fabianii]